MHVRLNFEDLWWLIVMMNSTERIISFHRRQTIHLFHFGSLLSYSKHFYKNVNQTTSKKISFISFFAFIYPMFVCLRCKSQSDLVPHAHPAAAARKKDTTQKSWKCTFFLRLSQRAFALDTKGTFTIFVPTSRVTVREKKIATSCISRES